MRNLHNKDRQTSLLGLVYCRADEVSSLIMPEDKGMISAPCPGNYINMVDCHCESIQPYIDEVGGLKLEDKNIGCETPLITEPIPVIPREWFSRSSSTIPHQVVGIRLGDILTHISHRNSAGVQLINKKLDINLSALSSPVFQGKKVVLVATGGDIIIETLWQKQFEIDLYQKIATAGFYAVTGMNFSLFLHECPLGHLINLNKSLKFCEELDKLGVPVIPHIYAINDTHREMWVDLLQNRLCIKTVWINTQMQRGDGVAMDEVKRTVQALLDNTDVNVVLNGFQPKNPTWGLNNRIVMANQFGLKHRAVVENAVARKQIEDRELLEPLLQQQDRKSEPRLRLKRIDRVSRPAAG